MVSRVLRILRSLRYIPFLFAFYEGFKSLVKIGAHFYNSWIEGLKDAAEVSERNAESIREAAQANEELRQKGDARTETERTEETEWNG